MSKQLRPNRSGYFAKLTFGLLILALPVVAFLNRQYLLDTYTYWRYKPSAAIQSIASRSELSGQGKFYLYASQPELDGRDSFNSRCNKLAEQAAVLGCYTGLRIYLFDVTDARLDGIEEVTAAHEMLHAAYDRLSGSDRDRIDSLIEQYYSSSGDQRLRDLVALYDKAEPGQRLNELHSILGTQIGSLPSELDSYYGRYFKNRSQIVAFYDKYESVFSDISARQASLVSEIEAMNKQISAQIEAYNQSVSDLEANVKEFNARADWGAFTSQSQFSSERNALVSRQTELNSERENINSQIINYDAKRKELDELNGQAQSLNRSINSLAPVQEL